MGWADLSGAPKKEQSGVEQAGKAQQSRWPMLLVILWMDKVQPKKPWKDDSHPNINKPWFPWFQSDAKWISSIHCVLRTRRKLYTPNAGAKHDWQPMASMDRGNVKAQGSSSHSSGRKMSAAHRSDQVWQWYWQRSGGPGPV